MADPEGINWLVALGIILIIVAIVAFILFIVFLISDSIDNLWAYVSLGVAVFTLIFGILAIVIGWTEKEKRRGKYEGRVKKKKKEDEVVTFYPESGRDYVDVSTSLASFGRPKRRVTYSSPYESVYGAVPPARPAQPTTTPSKWTDVQPEIRRPLRSPPKVATLRPSAPERVPPKPVYGSTVAPNIVEQTVPTATTAVAPTQVQGTAEDVPPLVYSSPTFRTRTKAEEEQYRQALRDRAAIVRNLKKEKEKEDRAFQAGMREAERRQQEEAGSQPWIRRFSGGYFGR